MNNQKIEVLPSPQELLRAPVQKEEFQRLLKQQVVEIMAERDALVFEPFFRSRQVAYELKRLQSVPEQEKFRIGYERYGCMDCKSQERPHAGNGLCHRCRSKWFRRYAQIIAEGIKGEPAKPAQGAWFDRLLPEDAARDGVHHTFYKPSNVTRELLLKCIPDSETHAMRAAAIIDATSIDRKTGFKTLAQLYSEGLIQRTTDSPFRYFRKSGEDGK